jgi:hypothetical protein
MDYPSQASFLWYNARKELKKVRTFSASHWKVMIISTMLGFLGLVWLFLSGPVVPSTAESHPLQIIPRNRPTVSQIVDSTRPSAEEVTTYNMCINRHRKLPLLRTVFMASVDLQFTVYEASLDKDAGLWKFLFVVDTVNKDGSRRPNDNVTIDEFGYYHSWQFNMSSKLKNITENESFVLYDLNRFHNVKCEHFYTDSFYELLCPVYNHPRTPPDDIRFAITHSLFEPSKELIVDVCINKQTISKLTHCGAILLNNNYKNQIVRYIHHHLALGVQLFHVFDRNGQYFSILEPYINNGIVRYHILPERHPSLFNHTKRVYNDQLTVFEKCKYLTRGQSEWIVMTDYDEWITIPEVSWMYSRYDQQRFMNNCLIVKDNTYDNVYQLDYIVLPKTNEPECDSNLEFYLGVVSDHTRYLNQFNPTIPMPMNVRPPSERKMAENSSWHDPNNTFEPMYNWYVPLNFQIYSDVTNENATLMTERFTRRQPHYQHRWAFKAFSRPHLSSRLLQKWAKPYIKERPYSPPERDYYEDGMESYVTMHKMDHLRHDYPRARPAGEIAFAHYISFNKQREWMKDDGGDCTVDDYSVNEPNRFLDNRFEQQ